MTFGGSEFIVEWNRLKFIESNFRSLKSYSHTHPTKMCSNQILSLKPKATSTNETIAWPSISHSKWVGLGAGQVETVGNMFRLNLNPNCLLIGLEILERNLKVKKVSPKKMFTKAPGQMQPYPALGSIGICFRPMCWTRNDCLAQ